jgi:HAD superfamily hydrolase (TIGR01662 family)
LKSSHALISHIFFDLGFTLITSNGDANQAMLKSHLALADSLARSGAKIDVKEFATRYGAVITEYYKNRDIDLVERPLNGFLRQTLQTFGQDVLDDQALQKGIVDMFKVTEAYWSASPDTHPTLQTLLSQGYKMGLISNASSMQDVNNLIDNNNLRDYFDCVVVSAEEKVRKPHPQMYCKALGLLDAKPEQSVMVGDTLVADIVGAQQAGMRAVWINSHAERPDNAAQRKAVQPDATINTLSELLPVLDSWR